MSLCTHKHRSTGQDLAWLFKYSYVPNLCIKNPLLSLMKFLILSLYKGLAAQLYNSFTAECV